ncbi:MAG: oxygenase MpaB family protein [Pseudoxanthomonas sp.]
MPDTRTTATTVHLADITREAYIYFGAGATVILQMANPGVGLGVARHSATLERPLDRLRATMSYVYATTLGTDEERAAVARHVNRAHAPVRSPLYNAFDPDLQLWVAATLYRSAVDLHDLFAGPLSAANEETLYREAWVYGSTLQVRDAQWPPTLQEFQPWWEAQRAGFSVDAEVREYVHQVLKGGSAPWYTRGLLPMQRFVTRGLLPPDLRRDFQLPWSEQDAKHWARFKRWAPRVYWAMPAFLRHLPAHFYLRDLRRRMATPPPQG